MRGLTKGLAAVALVGLTCASAFAQVNVQAPNVDPNNSTQIQNRVTQDLQTPAGQTQVQGQNQLNQNQLNQNQLNQNQLKQNQNQLNQNQIENRTAVQGQVQGQAPVQGQIQGQAPVQGQIQGQAQGRIQGQVQTQQGLATGAQVEQWRYRQDNGRWMYWMPDNRWVVWNGATWIDFQQAPQFQPQFQQGQIQHGQQFAGHPGNFGYQTFSAPNAGFQGYNPCQGTVHHGQMAPAQGTFAPQGQYGAPAPVPYNSGYRGGVDAGVNLQQQQQAPQPLPQNAQQQNANPNIPQPLQQQNVTPTQPTDNEADRAIKNETESTDDEVQSTDD